MRQRSRLQWWLLDIKIQRELQRFGEIITYVVRCLLIVLPAIFSYFTLMTDTYSTVIGLHAFNMVESNPQYAHYNERGITSEDLFARQIQSTIFMLIFLIVGSALFTGKKPVWFWGITYMLLWILLLVDLITVYSNILQIAAKIG